MIQQNKSKVYPVIDYRELNQHLSEVTADVNICANTLRKWHLQRSNIFLLNQRAAYLQMHIHKTLAISDNVQWQKVLLDQTKILTNITINEVH